MDIDFRYCRVGSFFGLFFNLDFILDMESLGLRVVEIFDFGKWLVSSF